MGAVDRKSRRGARQIRNVRPATFNDARPASSDGTTLGDWPRSAVLAQMNANPEVVASTAKPTNLPADEASLKTLQGQMCELAHLPSPLRRRPAALNVGSHKATTEPPPTTGSYRDQLRAKGRRALQLS